MKKLSIEEKDLLLRDLCARLPYDVVLHNPACNCDYNLHSLPFGVESIEQEITKFRSRPYLRPMSSMTEKEFEKLKEYSGLKYEQLDLASFQDGAYKCLDFYLNEVPADVVILVFDWLNAHHFDFRNLLGRGLAIDCTGLNVY